jgi:hypothetical protein
MWEGSLHCRIKRRKPATMLGLGGEKKRKAIGGLEISLEEREGRAFKWLARASSSLLDKNTGMSVVDGWFNCGPAYGWHVRVLSLSGSSDSCFGLFPAKYEEIAASDTVMAIPYLMQEILQSQTTPFHWTAERGLQEG